MPSPILELYSQTHYVTDGTTTTWNFSFAGGYISKAHVKAYRIAVGGELPIVIPILEADVGVAQVSIIPALSAGQKLVIYRDTPKDAPLVDYTDGQVYSEATLDLSAKQAVFVAAEIADIAGQALNVGGGVVELQELLQDATGAAYIGFSPAGMYPLGTVGASLKAALSPVGFAPTVNPVFTGTVTAPTIALGTAGDIVPTSATSFALVSENTATTLSVSNTGITLNGGGANISMSSGAIAIAGAIPGKEFIVGADGPARTSDAVSGSGMPPLSQVQSLVNAVVGIKSSTLLPAGKIHFSNGLLVQWGVTSGGVGTKTVTYPIPFDSFFGAQVSPITGAISADQICASVLSSPNNNTTLVVGSAYFAFAGGGALSGGPASQNAYWLAIGYKIP